VGANSTEAGDSTSAQSRAITGVENSSMTQNGLGMNGGVAAVGPATGGVRVPVAVRTGMRAVGSGTGANLRS
jgi:hypothetical protein